jgi:hypothetical protein
VQERRQSDQPADPAAQAKRIADRLALMDAGITDFSRWLTDLVQTGMASARTQPYAWWDTLAARLVDAQLPGLAEQVRAMGSDIHARSDWTDHFLCRAGRWWALTKAWRLREHLAPEELADLRIAIGWTVPAAEVEGVEALPEPWLVLGPPQRRRPASWPSLWCTTAGVPAFAFTPDLFPDLMAAAIERRDVGEGAPSQDIPAGTSLSGCTTVPRTPAQAGASGIAG